METPEICPLCGREIEGKASKHHLIPLLKGGKHTPTVLLHQVCHDKIHRLFTERQLQKEYNTIEKLLENEDVRTFVEWVKKKPNDFYTRTKGKNR